MELSNNTILITGGTSGFGLEFTKRFLALGNTVLITGRNQEKLDEVKKMFPAVHTDLAKEAFPHLDGVQIGSWFTPAENHTPEQMKAIRISDEAIAEMQEADIYVFGATFYNFAITSTLKAYLDHIARPGITFSYKEVGMPEGLLKNKKSIYRHRFKRCVFRRGHAVV